MVAAKLDKLALERLQHRIEGVDGGLEWRMRWVELYCFLGRHDVWYLLAQDVGFAELITSCFNFFGVLP
jgi:hypothetical protein